MTQTSSNICSIKKKKVNKYPDKNRVWRTCKSKIRYRSEGEAIHARTRINQKRDTPLEIYFCGLCNGYHLTKSIEFIKKGK